MMHLGLHISCVVLMISSFLSPLNTQNTTQINTTTISSTRITQTTSTISSTRITQTTSTTAENLDYSEDLPGLTIGLCVSISLLIVTLVVIIILYIKFENEILKKLNLTRYIRPEHTTSIEQTEQRENVNVRDVATYSYLPNFSSEQKNNSIYAVPTNIPVSSATGNIKTNTDNIYETPYHTSSE